MQKILINISQPEKTPKKVSLSLGCFDGIHLGHQELIKKLKTEAQKKDSKSCLCIFQPHPSKILKPNQGFKNLFTIDETIKILRPYNLDYLCLLPFDLDFSKLSAKDFIYSFIYPHFKPKSFVVGYDFLFGFNREGNFNNLREGSKTLDFDLYQVPALFYKDEVISSSRIKKNLSEGNMQEVNQTLGHNFFIEANVIKGDGRGRQIGFPTANLDVSKDKYLPKKGVYVCQVQLAEGLKRAVINLGHCPSFKIDGKMSVELHIIGEDILLYGQNLKVELLSYIRKEIQFSNIFDLKSQIQKDILIAGKYL